MIERFDLLKANRISDIAPGLIINIDETGFESSVTKNLVKKMFLPLMQISSYIYGGLWDTCVFIPHFRIFFRIHVPDT